MARRKLADLLASPPDVDRERIAATTAEEIERHAREDGEEIADAGLAAQAVLPPRLVRERLGLTQADFAAVLRVPLGTVRNWEQMRTLPDPAARSLLNAVDRAPVAVLAALSPQRIGEWVALGERLDAERDGIATGGRRVAAGPARAAG